MLDSAGAAGVEYFSLGTHLADVRFCCARQEHRDYRAPFLTESEQNSSQPYGMDSKDLLVGEQIFFILLKARVRTNSRIRPPRAAPGSAPGSSKKPMGNRKHEFRQKP